MNGKDITVMSKKEQVSHIFKELEDALHVAIDQGLTEEYHVLELIALSVNTYIEKCKVFALAQQFGYNPVDPAAKKEETVPSHDNVVSLTDAKKKGDLH